jgi:hypothetical protein
MPRPEELLWRFLRLSASAVSHLPRIAWLTPWLLGCAGVEPEKTSSARARYCGALCSRLATCAPGLALSSCLASCELDPDFERLNEQLWSAQVDCIGQQTCEALATNVGQDACFEEARAHLVASETCVDFCFANAKASFECGEGHSVAGCVEGFFCTLRDEVLAAGIDCNDMVDCSARAACLGGVLGP